MCCFLALPFAYNQQVSNAPAIDDALPPIKIKPPISKWEFGLRGGVGTFQSQPKRERINFSGLGAGQTDQGAQYYLGGFLTRNFNQRWSLRSELSLLTNPYQNGGISLGLFPRYKLTNWLSLEAGVEARQMFAGNTPKTSNAWLGAAFTLGKVEFNARFSPGYNHASNVPYSQKGYWTNGLQLGMSLTLGKKGKLSIGK